jgi:formate dehydrogenase major subunit
MTEKTKGEHAQLPVELKINGQAITARPGQTILEVVREQKLDDIPSLCHDPRLEPFGSCFVCVVEVKGARGFVPSCTTRIRDGMEVSTRNEKIHYARKSALELLLSDHYADCICPAQSNCPAGVDVQGYLGLAKLGHYHEALRLIKERNPLPVVCGRICVRKCELKCRRNDVDEPVGINYVKRFCAEHSDHDLIRPDVKPPTGKRVAVIGGGPAGLTCANYLKLQGHAITIFDAMPKLGGMLRWGIPEYRLPKSELDREIAEIISLGVHVITGKKLGKDFTLDSLKTQDKFDAVFLSPGAPVGSKLGVPGEDADGIESALDFLCDSVLKGPSKLHGKVVVVGGGNSAIDAARTAVRSGAQEVSLLYRRTRAEMPAHHEEVDAAEKEGVRLEILAAPTEVIAENGRLKALRCIRMELGEPDRSGRRSPVPIKGSEFEYPCDFVFCAIGQQTDETIFNLDPAQERPAVSRRGTITVDEAVMATNLPGVFAGGDAITGPAVVIDAIAHGRSAAEAIHLYLTQGDAEKPKKPFISRRDAFGKIPERMYEDVARIPRQHLTERNPEERKGDFGEVEFGLPAPEMEMEADRCMECGCKAQFHCDLRRYATDYNVDITRLSGAVRRHKVDNSHPLITLDPNKCILCGRCVRTCANVLTLSALGFVERGFNTTIKPSLGKPLAESPCISCGACIETCPTGALTSKLPYGKQGPWKSDTFHSMCSFCSLGCAIDIHKVTDGILWASSPETSNLDEGYLCFKGRFGTGMVQGAERLTKPLIRKNNQLVEAGWDEAIGEAARLLADVRDRYGSESVAVIAQPRMTLEECYLTGRMSRAALGTDRIGTFRQLFKGEIRSDLDDILGETASTCFREDIHNADVLLLMGADPSKTHPVLGMSLRRAVRKGAQLAVLNSGNIDLARSAKLWLDPRRGTMGILLAGVLRRLMEHGELRTESLSKTNGEMKRLSDSLASATPEEVYRIAGVELSRIDELVEMVSAGRKVVAIYDLDDTLERGQDDLAILAQMLILTGHISEPGSGLLLLQSDCNSEGARLAGMRQGTLLGGHPVSDDKFRRKIAKAWKTDLEGLARENKNSIFGKTAAAQIRGALVMLNDLLSDPDARQISNNLETMVVVDYFLTETAKLAHVVLPASTLVETNGTLISFDRRFGCLEKVTPPLGGLSTGEVLCRLSEALGYKMPTSDPARVRQEIWKLLGIAPKDVEKARQGGGAWPSSIRDSWIRHLRAVQLSSRAMRPVSTSYATLDGYVQRRLVQMGIEM